MRTTLVLQHLRYTTQHSPTTLDLLLGYDSWGLPGMTPVPLGKL